MRDTNTEFGMTVRFAAGIAAVLAVFLLPVHPPGPTRLQVIISTGIGLTALICMGVQLFRGRIWHRIVAGVLLILACILVVGMCQEWMELRP